jgi:hypothetical protein
MANIMTPYGKLIQSVELTNPTGTTKLDIIDPHAMLWYATAECASWGALFHERLVETPCSAERPWTLVLYSDEVTPGSALAHITSRKSQAIYWSFLELGASALSREEAWFTACTARSSIVAGVDGGLAQLLGSNLKRFFNKTSGDNLLDGITLRYQDRNFVFYAKLGAFLQDGLAHKETFHVKGDNGTRSCVLCLNEVSVKSGLTNFDGSDILRSSILREDECDLATDADILDTVKRLDAYKLTDGPTVFKLREQALGFNHVRYTMLLDPLLEGVILPATQFVHDWMHCMVAGGIFQLCLHLMLEALWADGVKNIYAMLGTYLDIYHWPRRLNIASMTAYFAPKRREAHRDAKTFKCPASHALSMYAVLAYYVNAVIKPSGRCTAACNAFLALCDLLDCFLAIPLGIVSDRIFRERRDLFLEQYQAAFGINYMIPKCHWLLHFTQHKEKMGTLLSCFVHERKHKTTKRYATDMLNTRCYDRSLLAECLCDHLCKLSDHGAFDFTIGPIKPKRAGPKHRKYLEELLMNGVASRPDEILISSVAQYSPFAACSTTDVVLIKLEGNDFEAGEVWMHASVRGVAVSLVSVWTLVELDVTNLAATWRYSENPRLIDTSDILESTVWTRLGDTVRTLLPPSIALRGL